MRTTRIAGCALLLLALLVSVLAGAGSAAASPGVPTVPNVTKYATLADARRAGVLDPAVLDLARSGQPIEGFLILDHRPTLEAAAALDTADADGPARVLASARASYAAQKQRVTNRLGATFQVLEDYNAMDVMFVRFSSPAALLAAVNDPEVVGVGANHRGTTSGAQSLPLVGQPRAAAWGDLGGPAIAIIDTGINFTLPTFGNCTAPGVPAGPCRVLAAQDFAPNDNANDDNGHGTNVAAIAAGMAPSSPLLSLDVFQAQVNAAGVMTWFYTDNNVLAAINWVIANGPAFWTRAMNLSLGATPRHHTSECGTSNPYSAAFAQARAQKIVPVVAAGNSGTMNNAFRDGVAHPACTPGALRVGAVYDANVGTQAFQNTPANVNNACNDNTTGADQVTCFSQSGSILSLWAPGCTIVAGNANTWCGTSQAAPHVAGAVAVLYGGSVAPSASVASVEAALTSTGPNVTDTRNNLTRRRLYLPDAILALRPVQANDAFASAQVLTGDHGSLWHRSSGATEETREPNHAGDPGGASLWYQWTAPTTGDFTFHTRGSRFDTLLAVYTGTSVSALTLVASNDDEPRCAFPCFPPPPVTTSSVTFRATAGTTYQIAVDGRNNGTRAEDGLFALVWDAIPTATISASGALTDPIHVTFSEPVGHVDASNFTLEDVAHTPVAGAIDCVDGVGTPVDCITGPVTAASLRSVPLIPGMPYHATVNPPGSNPVVDTAGNAVVHTGFGFIASQYEEESSAAASYTWEDVADPYATDGSYSRHDLPGASVSAEFYSGGFGAIDWITIEGPDQGIADVYIDGQYVTSFDQNAPFYVYGVVRTIPFGPVAPGFHTVRIEVSPQNKRAFVAVDDVRPNRDGRIEELRRPRFGWSPEFVDQYAVEFVESELQTTTARFTFYGNEVTWHTVVGPDMGLADVYIDGRLVATVDNFSPVPDYFATHTFNRLRRGEHTITIDVLGTSNGWSAGTLVAVNGWSVA